MSDSGAARLTHRGAGIFYTIWRVSTRPICVAFQLQPAFVPPVHAREFEKFRLATRSSFLKGPKDLLCY